MIHACPCWDAECPSQPELHDGRTPPKRFKVTIFAAKVPHKGLRVCCYHTRVCCVENQASPGGARSLKDGRRDCRLYLLCMQTANPLILVTLRERASPSHGSVQRGTPSTENSKNTDDHENTVRKPRWTPRESSASVFSVLPDQWHCVARTDILCFGCLLQTQMEHSLECPSL
jgi:hypothetical protein